MVAAPASKPCLSSVLRSRTMLLFDLGVDRPGVVVGSA